MAHAEELGVAYADAASPIRFHLVTRALLDHLPRRARRVADIGGGYGRQAILLARSGRSVAVLDPDKHMLELVRASLETEDLAVRGRVALVEGYGENASRLLKGRFDLVCCHSVVMYVEKIRPLLLSLSNITSPKGLISILTINPASVAMREGLQGRWKEAATLIRNPAYTASRYIPNRKHRIHSIREAMRKLSFELVAWYGVGVFTDHLSTFDRSELEEICELEWLAGLSDPYRSVARMAHLVFKRRPA
ncbi:MAG: methyltransferase domain-containing protein [Rhodospirillaceae bacterium]|nr:methyltransferase domain-containing protein [Rhodospirillaceae bacterium]